MQFIQYAKCSTCKKAAEWLKAHDISYEDRPIREKNPTKEELARWHRSSGLPLKRFFNTSGNLYKELQLKDRLPGMTQEEQLELLATDGMLVKRPLLVGEDFVLAGFREKEWEERFASGRFHRKPEYLYHGSQYRFDVVVPHAASGESQEESQRAIYAAETVDAVIPFALPIRWYPDGPEGRREFTCRDGVTHLLYGSLNPQGVGYVYKLKSESFEKIDGWQWISREEVVPEEVLEIRVKDYLDKVRFSEEAREINDLLYGNDKGGPL